MQTGDILHCTGHSWLSGSIRWATKSQFSHSALFVMVWGMPYIIDSQNEGTNLRPFDEWVSKYKYTYIVHRAPWEITERDLAIRALSKVGHTGYDFEGLILKQPWSLITGNYKKKRNEEERMYCSEYVSWVYGISESYRMTPQDLYDWTTEKKFIDVHRYDGKTTLPAWN